MKTRDKLPSNKLKLTLFRPPLDADSRHPAPRGFISRLIFPDRYFHSSSFTRSSPLESCAVTFFLTPIKMPQNFLDSCLGVPLNYLYIFLLFFFFSPSNQPNSARCILMSEALTGQASKATARLGSVTLGDGGGWK